MIPSFLLGAFTILLASTALAGPKNLPHQLPAGSLEITVTDLKGDSIQPLSCTGDQHAAVLIFTSVDCPIANAYAPEINRIAKEFAVKGVRLTLVHVDPALEAKEATTHSSEYALDQHTAVVIDRKHQLVDAVGATVTPEAIVINRSGAIVYRGRINNLYADFGDKRAAPSEHNLRDALDAVLSNKPVAVATTKTIGCIIEPLEGRQPASRLQHGG